MKSFYYGTKLEIVLHSNTAVCYFQLNAFLNFAFIALLQARLLETLLNPKIKLTYILHSFQNHPSVFSSVIAQGVFSGVRGCWRQITGITAVIEGRANCTCSFKPDGG